MRVTLLLAMAAAAGTFSVARPVGLARGRALAHNPTPALAR